MSSYYFDLSRLFISFDTVNVMLLFVALFVAILYITWDVNYFIRILFTIGFGRLCRPRVKPTDVTTIYGVCTTQDVDIFIRHMNNARYIRELDFARFEYYERSGLYAAIVKNKGTALQGASNIRYRRSIPIFTFYKVNTKLIHWDEKSLFLEQHFITLKDEFVRAVSISKQDIVGVNVDEMMKQLLGKDYKKSECPEEVRHWMQSVEITSARLRKSD